MKFRKKTIKVLIALTIVLGSGFVFFSAFNLNEPKQKEIPINPPQKPIALPKQFGLAVDSFDIQKKTVARNQFLSNILEEHAIDRRSIANIVEKSKSVFNVRKISAGNPYTIFTYKSDPQRAAYFIYQPNPVDYIVFDLRDSMDVYAGKKEVTKKTETLASSINHSLYDALQKNGGDPLLAMQLAEIYGWAIDFYAINKDDWFKIQYEREYVDGKPIGPGKIHSAVFSHRGKELEAYYFQPDSSSNGGFYDQEGNSVKRAFLKAPLKFSRITSRYTNRRLHPVQKVWKAHLGTDYAAPNGTPIIATGSGAVIESGFTKYNGNYVKVKHNGTYTTQYLHMSRRAVKRGQNIQQGQIIGYVGSTGLATGPHVCYRFWKNGKQVDALKQNFHETIPLSKEFLAEFKRSIIAKQQVLASLKLEDREELLTASNQADELDGNTIF